MEELRDSYKKSNYLHHAYLLVGEISSISKKLLSFLEKDVKVKISSNPDFWFGNFETFNIENAREVIERAGRKNFSEGKKVFIIATENITEEAQNSLLKVFEEPTTETHFFIISPQNILLPTLRSRMQIILSAENKKSSESILKMKLTERLEKVKEITEGISDEDKTKQDAINFLNEIETELYENDLKDSVSALKVCQLARDSLYDRGAPIKMILENVVLSI
jgi:hypothetical protein